MSPFGVNACNRGGGRTGEQQCEDGLALINSGKSQRKPTRSALRTATSLYVLLKISEAASCSGYAIRFD